MTAVGDTSALRHQLFRPLLISGLIRHTLASHFQTGLVEHQALRRLIWRRDTETSILIETWTRWKPQDTQHRPGVIIKQNDCNVVHPGVGDRLQGNPGDARGNPHFANFWVGSHTMFCLGGTGAQAAVLASETLRELGQFGPVFLAWCGLVRWQALSFGAVAKLEEHSETFVVPVTVGYAFEDRWVVMQQAPRLARVLLSLIA